MTSLFGFGDNVFFRFERETAEEDRKLQIKYDDSFNNDGTRNCYWCEQAFIPQTMVDFDKDGFAWKVCKGCANA